MAKIHKDIILFREEDVKLEIDIEANRLAAKLLMPENAFKRLVMEHQGDVFKIAEIFGVTTLVVRYRAKLLGIKGHRLD